MTVRPYLYFVAVVLLWASTPTVVDHVYREKVAVLVVLTAASGFAVLLLMSVAAATGRLRRVRSWSPRDWATIVSMGLLGIVGYTSLYYFAFRFAPADEINVVNYLWPVFLVLFSRPILGERHSTGTWFGVGLSFLGAAGIFIGWPVSFSAGKGVSFGWHLQTPTVQNLYAYVSAAAGAVCWALFSVLGKRLRYDKLLAMSFYSLVGAMVFGAALIVHGAGQWPSAASWIRLIYLGAAVNGIAYVLWFEALAGGSTAVFGSLTFITPFLALLYLRVFSGTPFRSGVWLSLAFIVTGSLIALRKRAKSEG